MWDDIGSPLWLCKQCTWSNQVHLHAKGVLQKKCPFLVCACECTILVQHFGPQSVCPDSQAPDKKGPDALSSKKIPETYFKHTQTHHSATVTLQYYWQQTPFSFQLWPYFNYILMTLLNELSLRCATMSEAYLHEGSSRVQCQCLPPNRTDLET